MQIDPELAAEPALRLSRRYQAAPSAVFRAFTEPALLRSWWGPKGFVITELDFDAVEGGHYRVALRSPEGRPYAHVGTFLTVRPPSRLVYSWRWIEGPFEPVETIVEVDFVPDGDGVIVQLCHSRFASTAERDAHGGWADSLVRLETWLAEGSDTPA